jgi:putative selenate reductase
MVDLYPAPLEQLLKRAFYELKQNSAIFDLPKSKFYRPNMELDTGVSFHGIHAGNPLGPTAGPHNQMIQNIALSWLGGSRIIELKTIQILDQLKINRPCIDVPNIGFNIEWSQELKLPQSLIEYVSASMMIDIFKEANILGEGIPKDRLDTIYDMSVGYDLKGISSNEVTSWIKALKDATPLVDKYRKQVPQEYRDLNYETELIRSTTVSTFHGCPKDEIEKIAHFLLTEMDLHTIIKLNPTQLPQEELNYILHDKLGYTDLEVNPKAYEIGITLDEACDIIRRLQPVAKKHNRGLGVKLSNTLEVVNKRGIFPKDEIMYMSGAPLHVIAMRLMEAFREKMGHEILVSFSAGVDKFNFPKTVACNLCPITTCTDLLKPGGYARLYQYMENLEKDMIRVGTKTIPDFILKYNGQDNRTIADAGMSNTINIVEETLNDQRYAKVKNTAVPKKINSQLHLYDCISCDKCIPVCPNDANFFYDTEPTEFQYSLYQYKGNQLEPVEQKNFKVVDEHQIANYVDFCNECGNCDTYCPEYGGPFIKKPGFFGSMATFKHYSDHDGFYVERKNEIDRIWGRIKQKEYYLEVDTSCDKATYQDDFMEIEIEYSTSELVKWKLLQEPLPTDYRYDMGTYHTLRILLNGILDTKRVNYVNMVYL